MCFAVVLQGLLHLVQDLDLAGLIFVMMFQLDLVPLTPLCAEAVFQLFCLVHSAACVFLH